MIYLRQVARLLVLPLAVVVIGLAGAARGQDLPTRELDAPCDQVDPRAQPRQNLPDFWNMVRSAGSYVELRAALTGSIFPMVFQGCSLDQVNVRVVIIGVYYAPEDAAILYPRVTVEYAITQPARLVTRRKIGVNLRVPN